MNLQDTSDIFFNKSNLNENNLIHLTNDALHHADDGELYLEYCQTESVVFDDGRVKSAILIYLKALVFVPL